MRRNVFSETPHGFRTSRREEKMRGFAPVRRGGEKRVARILRRVQGLALPRGLAAFEPNTKPEEIL
jgi:hypothetical protein